MNNGKSIDEMEALPLAESAGSLATNNSDAQELNLRRRRLIRGAVGVAPLVLTLRSGAAAAALSGCAPILGGTTFSTGAGGLISSPPLGIKATDKCIQADSGIQTCLPSPSGTATDIKPVGTVTKGTITDTSGAAPYYCTLGENKTVAIVSASTSVF